MSMLKASRNSELGRSVLVSSVNVEKKIWATPIQAWSSWNTGPTCFLRVVRTRHL